VPDFRLLASTDLYAANGLSLATGIASLAILTLGIAVLIRGRRFRAAQFFSLVALAAGAWQLCFAMMFAAIDPAVALGWARLGHFSAAFIAPAVFQFAIESTGRRRKLQGVAWVFWLTGATIGLLTVATDTILTAVRHYTWGYYPHARWDDTAMVVPAALMLFASIYVFWRTYRDSEGKSKDRAGALLIAFVVGSLGIFDYLPAVGVDMHPIAYFALLNFTVLAATAI